MSDAQSKEIRLRQEENRLKKYLPKWLLPLLRWFKLHLSGLYLLLAFLTGRIPIHTFRLLMYRTVFRMRIGHRTAFHWRARFYQPSGISIGNHTIIGYDCFMDGRYGITIGNNVNIAGEVAMFTAQHDADAPDFGMVGGPIVIEDNAYIGTRVTILPGVTIGEGAVVATGAVVVKNVNPYTMVGGVPAKYIKDRNRDIDYRLDFKMPFQ
jgi:maltose O-acetyltransferase